MRTTISFEPKSKLAALHALPGGRLTDRLEMALVCLDELLAVATPDDLSDAEWLALQMVVAMPEDYVRYGHNMRQLMILASLQDTSDAEFADWQVDRDALIAKLKSYSPVALVAMLARLQQIIDAAA